MKNIKRHCHKKVIVCFYNLGEEDKNSSLLNIFNTSIMVLFEINQRFKVHFLNELRVCFRISENKFCVQAAKIIKRSFFDHF